MSIQVDLSNPKELELGEKFPKLELKKDEVARICLLSKEVVASLCHWVEKIGYVHCTAKVNSISDMVTVQSELGKPDECFLCKVSAETQGKVNPPVRRFATKVIRYKTDVNGKPLTTGGLQMWVEIFLMGPDKFRQVMAKQREWTDLREHDLELTCTEAKFQAFDIEIKREALWMTSKELTAKIWKEESVKYNLINCLGQTFTEDVLRRRFASIERRNTQSSKPVDSGHVVNEKPVDSGHVVSAADIFNAEEAAPVNAEEAASVLSTPVDPVSTDDFDFVRDFLK